MTDAYRAFLERKIATAPQHGFEVDPAEVNPLLKGHQNAGVVWAVRGGRRALFEAFGLGKTLQQLEIVRLVLAKLAQAATPRDGKRRGLIVLPLGVRQEFVRDARKLGTPVSFIRRIEEADQTGIYLANYETVRDGKLDPAEFAAASLDEAAVLRGFGGVKTFREFMRLFEGVPYRFVATATPSPNEYIELLAYAAFLGVMDVGEAKTRFFKRNAEKADELTIHPHKLREFWLWVASWALFLQRPSDIGYDDAGYDLPPVTVHYHEVASDLRTDRVERDGQGVLLRDAAVGVQDAAREKRETLPARVAKLQDILAGDPDAHWLIWHDLEDERRAIERALPGVVSVWGSQDLDDREAAVIAFSEGRIKTLSSKPVLLGSGCNFQYHCHKAVFLGIGFKFAQFIQALHRIVRFLQAHAVEIHIIFGEGEREILHTLQRKWQQHEQLVQEMTWIIREFGISEAAMSQELTRSIGVERAEAAGEGYRLVNHDAVLETAEMATDSVDLICSSIPFGTQYEYSPSYHDMGHTDDNAHFWAHMDFLTPELLRVLRPGRNMVIHVKDRIVPGGMRDLGFQTVTPFHAEAIFHYTKHGFAYLGMKTVVTDVVRENNQTYRLGWTEQCKDGTRMGCGMPEYLLIFRKAPTDRSNGYADVPVTKDKPLCDDHGEPAPFDARGNWKRPVPGTGYSRARWQLDAHGFARSSGDRLLSIAELRDLPHDQIYRLWRDRSRDAVYDFAGHVAVTEEMDRLQRLPSTFMLMPPHSWHPDVWTDVARMRTLNTLQAQKGREQHLCPLPLDLVDRVITQMSMPGETVYDPFGGLGTVGYCALKLRRRAYLVELSQLYFTEAAGYLAAAARDLATPTLFDLLDVEQAPAAAEAAE